MSKVLNNAFYTGAILFGFVIFSVSFVVWAALEYGVNGFKASEPEVVHDTITIEVIREVQVECTKVHYEPKPVVKPKVETPVSDTTSTNI